MKKETIFKLGLLGALALSPKTSMGQNNQSFEDFNKARTEQFNKFKQQKDQKFNKFIKQTDKEATSTPETKSTLEANTSKVATYGMVVSEDYNLDINSMHYHESKKRDIGFYTCNNGVAVVMDMGLGKPVMITAGVLENGKINYYTDASGKKEKTNDKELKGLLNSAYQQYGEDNTPFDKALKTQNLTEQTKERLQKNQTIISNHSSSVGNNNGTVYSSTTVYNNTKQQNENYDYISYISNLVPPVTTHNGKEWQCGDIKGSDANMIQTQAFDRVKILVETLPLYQNLQNEAKERQLNQEEQTFITNHAKGMQGMGLYVGKDGKVHQEAKDGKTAQKKLGNSDSKTLDLTSYFIQNGGHNI